MDRQNLKRVTIDYTNGVETAVEVEEYVDLNGSRALLTHIPKVSDVLDIVSGGAVKLDADLRDLKDALAREQTDKGVYKRLMESEQTFRALADMSVENLQKDLYDARKDAERLTGEKAELAVVAVTMRNEAARLQAEVDRLAPKDDGTEPAKSIINILTFGLVK